MDMKAAAIPKPLMRMRMRMPMRRPSSYHSPTRTTRRMGANANANANANAKWGTHTQASASASDQYFPVTKTSAVVPSPLLGIARAAASPSTSSANSQLDSPVFHASSDHHNRNRHLEAIEADIEKVIYRCRFLTLLAVFGSLTGSFLCFVKGCTYIGSAFMEYFVNRGGKVILLLVEAIDVYLLGTVMLVFGMGLYELFVSNLDIGKSQKVTSRSNLFGLFALKERPRWLEIKSVSELKTKLGHVIVMLLLIGFFDKCKKAAIYTPVDLLCFSASVLLSSGCLFLLSKLNGSA